MSKKEVIPVQKELLDGLVDKAEKFDQIKEQLTEMQDKYNASQEYIKLQAEDKLEMLGNQIQELTKLERKLAEKDKEIARLKTIKNARQFNKTQSIVEEFEKKLRKDKVLFTFNSKELSQHDATVRHQICEKIREDFIKANSTFCGGQASREDIITTSAYNECLNDLRKFLDQIKKGE